MLELSQACYRVVKPPRKKIEIPLNHEPGDLLSISPDERWLLFSKGLFELDTGRWIVFDLNVKDLTVLGWTSV